MFTLNDKNNSFEISNLEFTLLEELGEIKITFDFKVIESNKYLQIGRIYEYNLLYIQENLSYPEILKKILEKCLDEI